MILATLLLASLHVPVVRWDHHCVTVGEDTFATAPLRQGQPDLGHISVHNLHINSSCGSIDLRVPVPHSPYQTETTPTGEMKVTCTNGADATVRPTGQFGSVVISCGKD
jgi:hypothetical protein